MPKAGAKHVMCRSTKTIRLIVRNGEKAPKEKLMRENTTKIATTFATSFVTNKLPSTPLLQRLQICEKECKKTPTKSTNWSPPSLKWRGKLSPSRASWSKKNPPSPNPRHSSSKPLQNWREQGTPMVYCWHASNK